MVPENSKKKKSVLIAGNSGNQRSDEQKPLNCGPYSTYLPGIEVIAGTFSADRKIMPVSCKSDRVQVKSEAKTCTHQTGSRWTPRSRLLSGQAPMQDTADHREARGSGLCKRR